MNGSTFAYATETASKSATKGPSCNTANQSVPRLRAQRDTAALNARHSTATAAQTTQLSGTSMRLDAPRPPDALGGPVLRRLATS